MAVTVQQKRAILWGLGILVALVLVNLAWAQICSSFGRCLSPY